MATQVKLITPAMIFRLVLVIFVFPLTPMIVSGAWNWCEAWVYAIISILGFVISRVLASRRHPDLLAERARSMEMQDAKAWDKTLAPMLAPGLVASLVIAGLDRLLGWTHLIPFYVKIASLVVIILGYALGSWALIENRFFSGVVRILTDRGNYVVTTGQYRLIRHPGYAGALLVYLARPIFLDSLWAFIPILLLIGVLVLRTGLENRTLQNELPGYREFTHKTRYRLFPGVW